jgi:hypothetical protein
MHNLQKQVLLILFELFALYKFTYIYIHLTHHDNEYRISLLNWMQANTVGSAYKRQEEDIIQLVVLKLSTMLSLYAK